MDLQKAMEGDAEAIAEFERERRRLRYDRNNVLFRFVPTQNFTCEHCFESEYVEGMTYFVKAATDPDTGEPVVSPLEQIVQLWALDGKVRIG